MTPEEWEEWKRAALQTGGTNSVILTAEDFDWLIKRAKGTQTSTSGMIITFRWFHPRGSGAGYFEVIVPSAPYSKRKTFSGLISTSLELLLRDCGHDVKHEEASLEEAEARRRGKEG